MAACVVVAHSTTWHRSSPQMIRGAARAGCIAAVYALVCVAPNHKNRAPIPRPRAARSPTPAPRPHARQPRMPQSITAACRGLSTGCPKPAALPWDGCASKRRTEDGQKLLPQLRCVLTQRSGGNQRGSNQHCARSAAPPPHITTGCQYHARSPPHGAGGIAAASGAPEHARSVGWVTPAAIDAVARASTMAARPAATQAPIQHRSLP